LPMPESEPVMTAFLAMRLGYPESGPL
jgi:hypothetical protein